MKLLQFKTQLTALIADHELDRQTDTPAPALAEYLCDAIEAYEKLAMAKDERDS